MVPKVLVILTSQEQHKSGGKTGWYLPEFAHPYYKLVGAVEEKDEQGKLVSVKAQEPLKAELVVASLKKGLAPLDPTSEEMFKDDPYCIEFLKHKEIWENTPPLTDFLGKASEFDALFYPGGHGPMYDLSYSAESQQLIAEFYKAGKPVAAVCHGPIVFADVTIDGKPLFEGKEATGFSNVEEDIVQLTSEMPRLLEDDIKARGGKYVKADEPWHPKVVVDGLLITGQNPNSAAGVGEAIAKAIGL